MSGPINHRITRLLIANRGEIACRIITTAQQLGITCIAVYSSSDDNARHVAQADESYYLGPAAASESYLNSARILAVASLAEVDAIHPGYGFLSENAEFAQACRQQGLIFIGPPTSALTTMASKSAAKLIMAKAGVPMVASYHGEQQDEAELARQSARIGYPQLIKAAFGGGGKGMRIVTCASEFSQALQAAKREAKASFGDATMLIERYLENARHIEIQLCSDNYGHCVYLSQRDCSIQRRHQKILEEAPAPELNLTNQIAMGDTAVAAAQAINYQGAGTIEFLYTQDGQFYFMEMNTRLQVEHPVTELITGIDLVAWQLQVACGAPLPLTQEQIQIRGHAIEVRICAEDPERDFIPVSGQIQLLREPHTNRHVRIDSGIREGDHISPYYDSMIAKLIVWGADRQQAISRMQQALNHYYIAGITTNLNFLRQLLRCPPLHTAQLHTHFIYEHADLLTAPALHKYHPLICGAMAWLEQNVLARSLPFTLHDKQFDARQLQYASLCQVIDYAKPDNQLTFDRLSSVYLANIHHDADQPCHLKLADPDLPIRVNLVEYAEPAQRYCPAAVYEIIELQQHQHQSRLQINAENCIHCKACDIKDPAENISWTPPEGGSGPNYSGM